MNFVAVKTRKQSELLSLHQPQRTLSRASCSTMRRQAWEKHDLNRQTTNPCSRPCPLVEQDVGSTLIDLKKRGAMLCAKPHNTFLEVGSELHPLLVPPGICRHLR